MTAAKTMSEERFWAQISAAQRGVLEANQFDVGEFMELRRAYLSGELSASKNRLDAKVEVPGAQDVRALPERETPTGREFIALGEAAILRGEVGIVVLNGGMATRFGGVVKGCVEVFDAMSFLALKARDIGRYGPATRMLLMNSFATGDKTAEHLRVHDRCGLSAEQLIHFNQSVSVRMTPAGDLFREDDGGADVSLYAPGHGDLQTALRRGALAKFRRAGGKYLMMSNVDNILATLDPLVVGMHVDASSRGVQMSVEAVQKKPGQVGGFIARVECGGLEERLALLKAAGFRLTPQRRAILEMFHAGAGHLTPQKVFACLGDVVPSLSQATVYNTLELLEEIGLVTRVTAQDGQTYFDPTVVPHHHALCDGCGEIFDVFLKPNVLQDLVADSQGFETQDSEFRVTEATVWLRGICKACQH